jgi:TRAP-type mannitol/chloroaromatic compound transport system permease small subunit
MNSILNGIERIIKAVGDAASLLILIIMAVVTFEVVSRYGFNTPTSWAWTINKQLFGVFVLAAGGYALVHNSHIRIEMLYERFSPMMKFAVRWLSLAAALFFLGSLFWKSGVMGWEAWQDKEVAMGVFKLPLYPLKLFMPVGAGLFILGCIATTLRRK